MKIKRLITAKGWLTFVLFILAFYSCNDCEDSSEPTIELYMNGREYEYTHAVGLGKTKRLEVSTYDNYYPISIDSDTTGYVFFKDSTSDTLLFTYKREFYYQSRKCGYVVVLNSLSLIETEAFKDARIGMSSNTYGYSAKNRYYIDF